MALSMMDSHLVSGGQYNRAQVTGQGRTFLQALQKNSNEKTAVPGPPPALPPQQGRQNILE